MINIYKSDDYTFHRKVSVEMCSSEDWVYEELWMIHSGCKSNHEHLEQSLFTEDAPQMCSHWWNDSCCGHVTHAGIGWEPHSPKIQGISKSVCWGHWHCLRSQRVWGRALSNPNKEVGKSIEGMRNWRAKQLYDTVVGNNLRKASRHYQTKENSFPKVLRKSIRFNS